MNQYLTFLHSGDMGDIISSLCSIKQLVQKTKKEAILYLDITGGMSCNNDDLNKYICDSSLGHGLRFNETSYNFIKPLIEIQPYIKEVCIWKPETKIDYNLNYFRKPSFLKIKHNVSNLLYLHQVVCGLTPNYNGSWLVCDKKKFNKKVVITRSCRYQSASIYYRHNFKELKEKAYFVGTDLEYNAFKEEVRFPPERYQVNTALDAAILINSSDIVYSNATLFYWISIGLGKNTVHELAVGMDNTLFRNHVPNIKYIQGARQVI